MHPNLLKDYRKRILPNIEVPIREIVAALWELPFVVDTNESCSGHIVTNDAWKRYAKYNPIRRGLYWYPHEIRLGVDFSLENELKELGESFRKAVSDIDVDIGLEASKSKRDYKTIDGEEITVLHVRYDSSFPYESFEPPQTEIDEFIKSTQAHLVNFWEAFGQVVRKYNPNARISSISDKNFLEIINWADLGDNSRYPFP